MIKKTRDKIYDVEKRNRCFVPDWKSTFSWLQYDEVNNNMLCTYCKNYPTLAGHNSFVKGSDTFHLSNLKSHDSSRAHLGCLSRFKTDNAEKVIKAAATKSDEINGGHGTIDKAFQHIGESEKIKMSNLFNISYFIGKEGKPLSDMEKQCKLAKKLGVDIGNNYNNFKYSLNKQITNHSLCQI